MSKRTNAQQTAEHRRRKVIALFSDPTAAPKVEDVAKALGVSAKTVARDLKTVRPDMKEAQGKLEEYQTQIQTHLPIRKRAELLADIAKQNDSPFAQLKALERADELDGIITDVERLKARKAVDSDRQPPPLFVLPEGTHVQVTINQQKIAAGSLEINQPAMRNVTPESADSQALGNS
jgi:hypothetical protein